MEALGILGLFLLFFSFKKGFQAFPFVQRVVGLHLVVLKLMHFHWVEVLRSLKWLSKFLNLSCQKNSCSVISWDENKFGNLAISFLGREVPVSEQLKLGFWGSTLGKHRSASPYAFSVLSQLFQVSVTNLQCLFLFSLREVDVLLLIQTSSESRAVWNCHAAWK